MTQQHQKSSGDGSIWRTGSGSLFPNRGAFAALGDDGSVVTWGGADYGGDSTSVADDLASGVVAVFPAHQAFAALKEDGSVVTWGGQNEYRELGSDSSLVADDLQSGVQNISSTREAFAALKDDGSVVTWGAHDYGGDSSAVSTELAAGVVAVYANEFAFAALKDDGSVTTWGENVFGGDSSAVAADLEHGVQHVYASSHSFAALKEDGSVVTWGFQTDENDSGDIADALAEGVVRIASNRGAFAALKEDGSVVTWGATSSGGSIGSPPELDGGVIEIVGTEDKFSALKDDGSAFTWNRRSGEPNLWLQSGVVSLHSTQFDFAALTEEGSVIVSGNQAGVSGTQDGVVRFSAVADQLTSGVIEVYSTQMDFAALKADGSVVTWGHSGRGGDSRAVETQLLDGVTAIYATERAFAALKADGSVVTWGDADAGGNSSDVADALSGGIVSLASAVSIEAVDPNDLVEGPPSAPSIHMVNENDIIDVSDETGSATVTGTADPGADVTVTFFDTVRTVTAAEGGSWSATFSTEELPTYGYELTITAQAAFSGIFGPLHEHTASVTGWDHTPVPSTGGDGAVFARGTGSGFTANAFLMALTEDGAVIRASDVQYDVSDQLRDGVVEIHANGSAFAALKEGGTVVAWGHVGTGGRTPQNVQSGVVSIASTQHAFAALKEDGSVVAWGDQFFGGSSSAGSQYVTNRHRDSYSTDRWALVEDVSDDLLSGVVSIYSTTRAFAALKEDGSVVTWGQGGRLRVEDNYGGDSSAVEADLAGGVVTMFSTPRAFAALKDDGSVVTWGSPLHGGFAGEAVSDLQDGVVTVFSNNAAFAALKADGSVVTWGPAGDGGDSSAVTDQLDGDVVTVQATATAFAALKVDGSVVTWGRAGGNSRSVSDDLESGVVSLFSTAGAFAALKEDGSVVTWGIDESGGDSGAVSQELSQSVVSISSSFGAFAALRGDGSVVTWGGGDANPGVPMEELREGVSAVYSVRSGFAALKDDGTVVAWRPGHENSAAISDAGTGIVSIAGQQPARLHGVEDGQDTAPSIPTQPPVIDDIADGGVINAQGKAEGVTVSGLLESEGAAGYVTVRFDDTTHTVSLSDDGTWSVYFAPDDIPDDGEYAIAVSSSFINTPPPGMIGHTALIPGPTAEYSVQVDTTPPPAPVIDTVAGDDVIDADAATAGITVRGTAEPEAEVAVTLGAAQRSVFADSEGTWQTGFSADDLPGQGDAVITATATDAAGNTGPGAERVVSIDTDGTAPDPDTPPPAPEPDTPPSTPGPDQPAPDPDSDMLTTPIRALRHGAEPSLPGGLWDTATVILDDGSFLLIESGEYSVVARRFSREGELLSERPFQSEEALLTETGGRRVDVDATVLDDGRIFVAWAYDRYWSGEGLNPGVYTQVFDYELDTDQISAVGEPVRTTRPHSSGNGVETLYEAPQISQLDGGEVIVTAGSGGNLFRNGFHRAFESDGTPLGPANLTSTYPGGVAALGDGGYVFATYDEAENHDHIAGEPGIFLQHFSPNGQPTRDVYSPTTHLQMSKYDATLTALNDGGFMLTYTYTQPGSYNSLHMQRFSQEGAQVGPRVVRDAEETVFTSRSQPPLVVELPDETVVVAWAVDTYDRSPYDDRRDWSENREWIGRDTRGIRLGADGWPETEDFAIYEADGGPFLIGSNSTNHILTMLPWEDGSFTVVHGDRTTTEYPWDFYRFDTFHTQLQPLEVQAFEAEAVQDEDEATGNVLAGAGGTSIAVEAVNGTALAPDPDAETGMGMLTLQGALGSLTMHANGRFFYDPDAAQHLPEGAVDTDSFTFTVSDHVGDTAEAALSVTVTGINDPATITGDTTGAVIEDDDSADQAEGVLTVTDPDAGEDRFADLPEAALAGDYGDFTFDPDTGAWRYQLDNDRESVRDLGEWEVTDSLTVTSLDGTATETITVTITGTGPREPEAPEPQPPETPAPEEPDTGEDELVLSGIITDRANEALSDVVVVLAGDDGDTFETQTDEDGAFTFTLDADAAGRIDAAHDYSPGDSLITASDALQVLRLAVGLEPSWGPASAHDFIAADINRDGSVTAADALDVLRAAVGLESEHAPRWVFIDDDADLGHIDSENVSYDTGIDLAAINADAQHSMSGILLGSMGEYA